MNYVRVLCLTFLATVAALPLEAATATWDRNPEPAVTGYIFSYGTQSGVHPTSVNVGNVLTHQFFPPPGRYYAVVQAYTATGGLSAKSAEVVFDIAGTPTNQAPSLTQPANQTTVLNATVSLTLTATDPEGSAITYTASGLPPGLTLNASTGVIAGTVTTQGTSTVTATASDGSLTASRTFTWTVTGSGTSTTVVLSPIDTVLTVETPTTNQSALDRLEVMTFPDYQPAQVPLMRFDVSQIPANATIQSATLELVLIKADALSDPNYSVSLHQVINHNADIVRATARTYDGTNSWTANACCSGGHPLAQADISPARSTVVVNKTLGTRTWDAVSLVQAWRASPASNYGLVLNADVTKRSGQYRRFASMEHAVASQRPLMRVTYVVSGTGGDTTAPTVSVTAPANNTTVSGNSVSVTATAADAVGVVGVQFRLDGANLGAEDMTAPYSVAWNTTTATNASHQLTAIARDLAGNSRTSTAITVTVNNNRAPTLTQPANQTSGEGSAASLALTASDPDGNALTYSATGLPGGLAINATSGLISGTPTFTSAGVYSVTATASDGSLSQSRTFSWTITNTNRAPSLTQPANQTGVTGTAASLSLTASDPDGTAVTFTATGLPPGLAINATSGVISGTPTQAGTYSVTATATDGSLSQSRTFSWVVTMGNRAPIVAQPADQSTPADTDVTLQISASDPDGTALTYQATGLPPALTINASTGLISGRVIASSAGVHSVTVTVSDGALTTSRTFVWSVNDTDTPVPGDYDGDGRDDPATYRKTTGEWRVWPSANNFAAATPVVWGVATDITVPADYDGDGRTDVAVYRPSTGRWHILLSSTNQQSSLEIPWGNSIDRPIPIDYDNDGRADLALPRFGGFDILLSGSNYTTSVTVR